MSGIPVWRLALMKSDGLAIGGGPPYFVTSLLDHPDFTPEHLEGVRTVGLGGSTVPVAVTRRLNDLGINVFRSYGSTEHPSITGSRYDAPEAKRLYTDGCALSGVEVRLADDGEILSRGPDLCLGYTDDALTAKAFDDDGWYHTGDVGEFDEDGYLTITDRKSDIIIRGGENISAVEVEEALLGMPGVAEAVVVAAPDARYGEHATAVLRMRPATTCRGWTTCARTSRRAAWPGRSGPRNCRRSATSRAPPAARCRSTRSERTSTATNTPKRTNGRESASTLRLFVDLGAAARRGMVAGAVAENHCRADGSAGAAVGPAGHAGHRVARGEQARDRRAR